MKYVKYQQALTLKINDALFNLICQFINYIWMKISMKYLPNVTSSGTKYLLILSLISFDEYNKFKFGSKLQPTVREIASLLSEWSNA